MNNPIPSTRESVPWPVALNHTFGDLPTAYVYLYSVKKLCRHCKHVFPWQILEFWNSDFVFGFIDLEKYLLATKGYIFS